MNSINYKKYLALKNILYSFEVYKGGLTSRLSHVINALKTKISENEYNELNQAFKDYEDDMLNILANTKRVFVKLDNPGKNAKINFENMDELFKDLEI